METFRCLIWLVRRCATITGVLLFLGGARLPGANAPGLQNIVAGQSFTFAVLGDNRGDDSGDQPQAFLEVLQAVAQAGPAFVLDSGDMIYGHTPDEMRVRDQWRRYRAAIDRFRLRMFHVPGNHDLWDEPSARIYQELWGKTYYSFDYGNARFIGLDTERANGHLGEEQLYWLEQQFEDLAQTNVFVFLHRPLFPVDGGIGSSLDKYESERDRIHQLFVRNRKRVRGVFAGHEHLFSFQQRDGVPYYISGGGGAPLYMAPELGGFHHFLLVQVQGDRVEVQLHKVCPPMRLLEKPKRVAPGEVLESWTHGLFWYAWDQTASIELTPEQASEGRRGLRLNFDLAQYGWPVLALSLGNPWDLSDTAALRLDVYVPNSVSGPLVLTPTVQGSTKHEGPGKRLKPGWNTITTDLNGPWMPMAERRQVTGIEWSLSNEGGSARGYAVFDNLRAVRAAAGKEAAGDLLESWERPWMWRLFDETVHAEIIRTNNPTGLFLHLNFAQCDRPVLFARLNPPWDLTQVKELLLQIAAPGEAPKDLKLGLQLRANEVDFSPPPLALDSGGGLLRFKLKGNWLPPAARAAVEQIGFTLTSANTNRPIVLTFERLSAAGEQ